MTTTKLTEAEVQNCQWTFSHIDGPYRISIGRGTHPVTGVPIMVERKEFMADDELQKLNAEERTVHDTRRWSSGMGSDKGGNMPMIHVARTPLNKFFADLAPRLKQGDREHTRWWLNRDENLPFRTRSGKL